MREFVIKGLKTVAVDLYPLEVPSGDLALLWDLDHDRAGEVPRLSDAVWMGIIFAGGNARLMENHQLVLAELATQALSRICIVEGLIPMVGVPTAADLVELLNALDQPQHAHVAKATFPFRASIWNPFARLVRNGTAGDQSARLGCFPPLAQPLPMVAQFWSLAQLWSGMSHGRSIQVR